MLKYADRIYIICKRFRSCQGFTQEDVGKATGYSKESICAFEKGRLFTYKIFIWYIDKGLNSEWCRRLLDE